MHELDSDNNAGIDSARSGWRPKFLATFVAVGLLAGIGVGIVLYTSTELRSDALVINLAGAQRMLSQKMVKEALLLEESGGRRSPVDLREAIDRFDRVLGGLLHGDNRLGIPATDDPAIYGQLGRVRGEWLPLRAALVRAAAFIATADDWRAIKVDNASLLRDMDAAVLMLQEESAGKVNRMILAEVLVLVVLVGAISASWFWIVSPLLKQISASMTRTEEQFRTLLETAPDAILIADPERRIVSANQQAELMFLHSRDQLLGVPLSSLLRSGSGSTEIWDERVGPNGCTMEAFGMRAESGDFPAEISARSIPAVAGGDWLVMAVRDMTDRKMFEAQLVGARTKAEAANRIKSEFLAAMSHEIRTPMNAIMGMADLLWESSLNPDQRQYVEVFRRAGSNLLLLIDGILDLSKIEAGNFELDSVDFDLESVADEAMELVSAPGHAKGLAMILRYSPEVGTGRKGDPHRLRQVLLNLLGNAIKFTESGQVILSVEPSPEGPEHVRISVTDSGIGIPPEKHRLIFENFAQADTSVTRKYGGSGLGLAISRHLVSLMGGELSVSSEVGRGSTFAFTIHLGPGTAPERLASVSKDFHGARALVIDNNSANRMVLREALAGWGFRCVDFGAPEPGIEEYGNAAASGDPYSLVIVDRHLPRLDGFEVAAQIRELGGAPTLILLSSDMWPGDVARSETAGFTAYGIKPIRRSELLRLICNGQRPQPEAASEPQPEGPKRMESPTEGERPKLRELAGPERQVCAALRILIAEDSPDNRLLFEAYLKGTEHKLTFVEDGSEAIKMFDPRYFDLVLMDIAMPNVDGLTATRMIRAKEKDRVAPRTPIIACTANARPQDVDKSLESGCDGHLSKPVSRQKLLSIIESYGRPGAGDANAAGAAPEPASIFLTIPPGLEEIAPRYLAARRAELAKFAALLQAGDFGAIGRMAHNLKGTGSSYGMPAVTELGKIIENAAKKGDPATVAQHLADLSSYLGRVELRSEEMEPVGPGLHNT